jgi:hypothetical protein
MDSGSYVADLIKAVDKNTGQFKRCADELVEIKSAIKDVSAYSHLLLEAYKKAPILRMGSAAPGGIILPN